MSGSTIIVATRAVSDLTETFSAVRDLRDILRLAVPAMLALASHPLLNIGETAMVGRLGTEPLAARAVGAALSGALYWVFAFLTFGSTTLIGYHYGAKDFKACGETFFHAVFLAVLGGLFIATLCIIFAADFFHLMGTGQAVALEGIPYFRLVIASAPLTLISLSAVGFFRGVQDTRTPMLMAFFTSGLQLILDTGLIYGHLGLPRLGLTGAGLAALVAQLAGALTYIAIFFYSARTADYRSISWGISVAKLRPLFRIGHDLAIRTGALRGSLIFATSIAARMGAVTLSAYEIAFQLFMLCSDIIDGLAVAGQALVAKYLGSRQDAAAYRMVKTLVFCGIAAGTIFMVAFLSAQQAILDFFTTSSEVVLSLSGGLFLLVALLQPLNGVVFVLDGALIGARDTRYLMWAMLIGGLGIFVPISWLSLHYGWGLAGILIGIGALMSWRLLTNFLRFAGERWMYSG
ncbi:MAG: MATE family efflux transporter [Deltaproteobacteria bacterium]|nr:MATE family efflux transporter [Deltaproteobacteria bacterium]